MWVCRRVAWLIYEVVKVRGGLSASDLPITLSQWILNIEAFCIAQSQVQMESKTNNFGNFGYDIEIRKSEV